ncbi:MAG: hypothetical protein R6X16_13900 [Anaerolineae bacterium]
MPLPMVHLTVAVTMLADLNFPRVPEFLLGNLAPDAIHMREGWTPDDKRRTHLFLSSGDLSTGADGAVLALLASWNDRVTGIEPLHLGYAVHLLTDLRWREQIWLPLKGRLPGDLGYQEERALYYRETDEVDRLLFESAPWRPEVWRLLATARQADVPGMVSAQEIDLWRQRTLHWFEQLAPASEPLAYLSLELVQDFARDTGRQVAYWLAEHGHRRVNDALTGGLAL